MEVIILKMNYTRPRLWKVLKDKSGSKLFTHGNGVPLKRCEYEMIEITCIGCVF